MMPNLIVSKIMPDLIVSDENIRSGLKIRNTNIIDILYLYNGLVLGIDGIEYLLAKFGFDTAELSYHHHHHRALLCN